MCLCVCACVCERKESKANKQEPNQSREKREKKNITLLYCVSKKETLTKRLLCRANMKQSLCKCCLWFKNRNKRNSSNSAHDASLQDQIAQTTTTATTTTTTTATATPVESQEQPRRSRLRGCPCLYSNCTTNHNKNNDDANPFTEVEKLHLYKSININKSLLLILLSLIVVQFVTIYLVTTMSVELNHKLTTMTNTCVPLFQQLTQLNDEAAINPQHTNLDPDEVTKFTFQVMGVLRLVQTLKRNQCSRTLCDVVATNHTMDEQQ